jgi:GntR family transcriptional regulator
VNAVEKDTHGLRRLLEAHDNGMPKYLRLRNALAAAIGDGRWKPGARLPPEERLTQVTGLSLGTVQRALRTLADEGLVVRRHGTGTFVSQGESPMHAPFQHCRFLDEDGGLLPIYSTFVRRREVDAAGEWSRHLPQRKLMVIERTFSINGEFSIYTHLYFDRLRLPVLATASAAKLTGVNMKALIAGEMHIPLAVYRETMRVTVFPAYVCAALGVKRATSGAVLQISASDRSGEPVYFQDLHIPPTSRRLFIA